MKRRSFIKVLFQGTAYVLLASVALMAMPRRRVIVQQSPMAGVQYHKGESIFHRLRVNTPEGKSDDE